MKFIKKRSDCWCGDSYGLYGRLDENECNIVCNGSAGSMCGGDKANNIYELNLWTLSNKTWLWKIIYK